MSDSIKAVSPTSLSSVHTKGRIATTKLNINFMTGSGILKLLTFSLPISLGKTREFLAEVSETVQLKFGR